MTIFDAARHLRVPGVSELHADVYPTQLTNRTRIAAQRMIRTANLTGGYASKTRALAHALLDKYAPHVPYRKSNTIHNVHRLPTDAVERMATMVEAAVAVANMAADHTSEWYVSQRAELAGRLRDAAKCQGHYYSDRTAFYFSLYNYEVEDAFLPQLVTLLDEGRVPQDTALLESIAAMLGGTDPIRISVAV
jgi:hypothetical protein